MTIIDDSVTRENVLKYLIRLKREQKATQEKDFTLIVYTPITLKYAIKNKILIPDFLTHSKVLRTCNFSEEKDELNDVDAVALTKDVLQHELTCALTEAKLDSEEINTLIKFVKKIETKLFKKEKSSNGKSTDSI